MLHVSSILVEIPEILQTQENSVNLWLLSCTLLLTLKFIRKTVLRISYTLSFLIACISHGWAGSYLLAKSYAWRGSKKGIVQKNM